MKLLFTHSLFAYFFTESFHGASLWNPFSLILSPSANSVMLLRNIGKRKKQRESANNMRGFIDVELCQLFDQSLLGLSISSLF